MEEKDTLKESEQTSEDIQNLEQVADENQELSEDEKAYKEFVDSLKTQWYVLHTFSGYENVAKENLETVVEKFNLQDRIFDIVIPMEEVPEEKNGKKKFVQRKTMPCYIFVKMKYADDIWHNVIRTRGITGFAGPKGRPLALTDEEVRKLGIDGQETTANIDIDFQAGDQVEIINGPMYGKIGSVISANVGDGTISVSVEMFGRDTQVEVKLSQIRKVG